MKVELTMARNKELPEGAVPALEKELLKRLRIQFVERSLVARRAGSNVLIVYGGATEVKNTVGVVLQETWESEDDWFN